MERLFNLDFQLLHDAALLAIAVFFLFLILSHLLFNPVRKLLEDRKAKIAGELENAANDQEQAKLLQAEYEAKLQKADEEAEAILTEARKKALKNEERIVADAKAEAARIIARANEEVALEEKRVRDSMKQEIIQVAQAMAGKVVASNMDVTIQESLVDETLKEMGDSTWQN